jgi:hypothetical protein
VRGKWSAGSCRQQLNLQHHHGCEGALLLAAHGQQPEGLALGALCMGARHLHAITSHLCLPLQADDRASQGRDLALCHAQHVCGWGGEGGGGGGVLSTLTRKRVSYAMKEVVCKRVGARVRARHRTSCKDTGKRPVPHPRVPEYAGVRVCGPL